jgi:hypothetical protein
MQARELVQTRHRHPEWEYEFRVIRVGDHVNCFPVLILKQSFSKTDRRGLWTRNCDSGVVHGPLVWSRRPFGHTKKGGGRQIGPERFDSRKIGPGKASGGYPSGLMLARLPHFPGTPPRKFTEPPNLTHRCLRPWSSRSSSTFWAASNRP